MTTQNNNVEEFFNQPEVAHTLKLVPESQRELFVAEMEKHLSFYTADIVGKIKNFDVGNDAMGNPVENPLMRLNDVKAMILEFIKRDNK